MALRSNPLIFALVILIFNETKGKHFSLTLPRDHCIRHSRQDILESKWIE